MQIGHCMLMIRPKRTNTMITWKAMCSHVITYCPNQYAKMYAHAGLRMEKPENQAAQAYYILSNISRWNHPQAQRIRDYLKDMIKKDQEA